MTHLFLIRHGENQANLTKEFSHRKVDYPLTPKGELQAEQTADFLRPQGIAAVYSSPLRRAMETAAIIGATFGLPVTVLEQFREINVGVLEEQPPTEENWRLHNNTLRAWVRGDYALAFPGGEDYYTLFARAMVGYRTVLASHPDQKVVIVAHGGIFTSTIKALCPESDLLALLKQENHNCSITEVQLALDPAAAAGVHGHLVRWAAADHLTGYAAEVVAPTPDQAFFAVQPR